MALAGSGELCRDGPVVAQVADPRSLAVAEATWSTRYRSVDDVGLIAGDADAHTLHFDPGPDSDTTIRGVPNLLETLLLSPDGGWLSTIPAELRARPGGLVATRPRTSLPAGYLVWTFAPAVVG